MYSKMLPGSSVMIENIYIANNFEGLWVRLTGRSVMIENIYRLYSKPLERNLET
jgi:hypothetical protein